MAEIPSPARTIVKVALVAFSIELLSMLGLALWQPRISPVAAVLDAAALALLIAPATYWLVLKPFQREYRRRLEAEMRAEEFRELSMTDSLTRCMNRRGILAALSDERAEAIRYQYPLSIALVDLDHFKAINDRHGHPAGDVILREFADLLAGVKRVPDRLGRFGGEEFLLLLPETDADAAAVMMDRIRREVEGTAFGPERLTLTISAGVAQLRPGENVEDLLARVDASMYRAKSAGRNLVDCDKASAVD